MTKFLKLKTLHFYACIAICFMSTSSLFAQYLIDAPTSVNLGETKTIYVKDVYGYSPSFQDSHYYEWYVDEVSMGPFFNYYDGDDDMHTIDIEFTIPGINTISVMIFGSTGYFEAQIDISVIGTYPDTPEPPTFNNNVCNPVITRNGTPQNGDVWYWQGKDPDGTIESDSGITYAPNESSGTYYIRAKSSNGIWDLNSVPVEVTIVSETLWYTDVDNDGFGDPDSTPISSCTQPSGRVSNNFDACPTIFGNLLNNGCAGDGDLGATDKSYVHTITPLKAVSDISQLTNDNDKLENVTYFDGLGRAIQNVAIRAGGQKQDIKSVSVYDEFGRQAKTYLPHATVTSTSLNYTNNTTIISDIESYYLSKHPNQLNAGTPNPYAEQRFDDTPLSRALESGTPGETWEIDPNSDNDHTTKYEYGTNIADEVYEIDYPGAGQSLSLSEYYNAGELIKNTVKNANWQPSDNKINTKDVFTDKGGKKITEYSYILENSVLKILKTYYVYDDVGNLVYVLTPKIFSIISGSTISVTNLNDLAFQYIYDVYNRQIEQKVPGKKQWEYMVYDQLDRPILTQDSNLKDDDEWLFTKYDAFGRAIYGGIHTSILTRTQLQAAVDTYISTNTNNLSNIESRTSASSIGGITINYSNNAYPTTSLEVLTVNYYDDYAFTDADKPTTPISILGEVVTTRTNGLPTGSWTKTLSAASWAKSYSYYDEKGSVIYVYEKNHLGGYTENKSKLDFRGKVEGSLTQHKRLASDNLLTIKDYFTYDHAERAISHTQSIGGNADLAINTIELDGTSPTSDETKSHTATTSITISPNFTAKNGFHASIQAIEARELISLHTYDELGQLTTKKIGGQVDAVIANSTGLQTIDYSYDIRGTLKGINDVDAIGDDLFAFALNYETGEGSNFSANDDAQYNGNISQMVWKSAFNNTKKSYLYTYDDLNRFTKGRYGEGSSLTTNWQKFDVNVSGYDHNGNITGLTRNGGASGSAIDNLTYSYDIGNGNQLMKITDSSTSEGFSNGSSGSNEDYEYDDNGNLIKDNNKGISLIEYNHLDLVKKVSFISGNKIEFLYDASGAKLQMIFTPNGGSATTTQYIGGFRYQNNELQFFPSSEGYIEHNNSNYNYVYTLKDHLGNNRMAFKDVDDDNLVSSSEILSSKDYYPMGLTHYGEHITNSNYNYKYQGKEQLLSSNYNMYDFGSRMYDASVGRWFNVDPQNIFASPYLAMGNNWVISIDPNGQEPITISAILIGAAIGAGAGAATYSLASLASGDWNWKDFGTSVGYGALGGALTAGLSAAGTALSNSAIASGGTGAFWQSATFNMLSGVTSQVGTSLAFGDPITAGTIGGAVAGGLIGAKLPGWDAVKGGYLKNAAGELIHNGTKGTIRGAISGGVGALIDGKNPGEGAFYGARNGAIGGVGQSTALIGYFGATTKITKKDSYYIDLMKQKYGDFRFNVRKRGIHQALGGWEVTWGNTIVATSYTKPGVYGHEYGHIIQYYNQGWAVYQGTGLKEQFLVLMESINENWGEDSYLTSGTNENNAERNVRSVGGRGGYDYPKYDKYFKN